MSSKRSRGRGDVMTGNGDMNTILDINLPRQSTNAATWLSAEAIANAVRSREYRDIGTLLRAILRLPPSAVQPRV
jgi:hypothetical protein